MEVQYLDKDYGWQKYKYVEEIHYGKNAEENDAIELVQKHNTETEIIPLSHINGLKVFEENVSDR